MESLESSSNEHYHDIRSISPTLRLIFHRCVAFDSNLASSLLGYRISKAELSYAAPEMLNILSRALCKDGGEEVVCTHFLCGNFIYAFTSRVHHWIIHFSHIYCGLCFLFEFIVRGSVEIEFSGRFKRFIQGRIHKSRSTNDKMLFPPTLARTKKISLLFAPGLQKSLARSSGEEEEEDGKNIRSEICIDAWVRVRISK